MSQSILFLAHVAESGNTLPKTSYEVLGAALRLRKQLGSSLTIGLIGADVSAAAETVANAGAERVLAVAGPDFAAARYASDAAAAEAICRSAGAELILAPATSRFMRVLPGVAHRLNGCVDTHVTALEAEAVNGELRATRWHYRQRIEAVIRRDTRPWIVLLESGCAAAWTNTTSTGTPAATKVEQIPVTLPEAEMNGCDRYSRSEERRTNHQARRRLVVCRWRRLDQKAVRWEITRRSSRNFDSRLSSCVRCIAWRQQITRGPVRREPGRARLHDASESGRPDRIDAAPSERLVHLLPRRGAPRRWLALHQRAPRRKSRPELRMGARKSRRAVHSRCVRSAGEIKCSPRPEKPNQPRSSGSWGMTGRKNPPPHKRIPAATRLQRLNAQERRSASFFCALRRR